MCAQEGLCVREREREREGRKNGVGMLVRLCRGVPVGV